MTDGARLLAHKGAQLVQYDELAAYQTPEATETFKPIAHKLLVDTLKGVMADRGMFINREQYAVDKNGLRIFGTFDLEWQKMEEYGAAVCFRQALDRTMPVSLGVGARVFICDNMSMLAELITVRKHTSKLDLAEEMDRAMYRYMQGFRRLQDDIQVQKDSVIEERRAKTLIYDIFRQQIVPLRLFHPVSNDLTHIPTMDLTAWRLHNVFTSHIKKLAPSPAFRATTRLGKFFASKF